MATNIRALLFALLVVVYGSACALRLPGAESHVRQGDTTALGGPDGGGPWPCAAHLEEAANVGVGMNVGFMVGHNTVRRAVMGLENRAPTESELQRMKRMVANLRDRVSRITGTSLPS